MAGITDTGFEPKILEDIGTDLEAALKEAFGESVPLHAQSRFGQLKGIVAAELADLWEALEDVYSAQTVDGATGVSADDVCAITGTIRDAATESTVTAICTGTDGTILPSGRVVSVVTTGVRFATLADATIAAATAWVGATVYVAGDLRTNSGNMYVCTVGGTSAGSGGPTTTGSAISDNTVTWAYLGSGVGYVEVACEAEDTGPNIALAYTLTTIETPISGWTGVSNLLDAEVGSDVETDPSLMLKRDSELNSAGKAIHEAIRSGLLDVDDVTSVKVFHNDTDVTDGDGIPPHAVEALVVGGTDAAIRTALFGLVGGGIQTYGNTSGTVTDEEGFDHTVRHTRPTDYDVYVRVDLVIDPDTYPDDGDTQVKEAIADYGNAGGLGRDAVSSVLGAQAARVTGVLEITLTYISLAPAPTLSTTIPIAIREQAVYDTGRITVNTSDGTP